MSTQKEVKVLLANMKPTEIIADPRVANKFIAVYNAMHHNTNGKLAYESERLHMAKLISDNPQLAACDPLSLYACFLDGAVNRLSFNPALKQMYLVPFGKKAVLMIGADGELALRQMFGQIKYADNPVLVYDGDTFEVTTDQGKMNVKHSMKIPRKTDAQVIACYLKITRPDGSIDYSVMTYESLMELKAFSKQPGSLAWTKGLPGMFKTKTMKHAFRSYPKVKVGQYSKLESQTEDIEHEEIEMPVDYSLPEEESHLQLENPPAAPQATLPAEPKQNEKPMSDAGAAASIGMTQPDPSDEAETPIVINEVDPDEEGAFK